MGLRVSGKYGAETRSRTLGVCLRSKLGDPLPEKNEVIMIRLQMIAATHAIQTHSTVVGVDEIRKDIEVFVQHSTMHAGHRYVNVCASVYVRLFSHGCV